MSKFMMGFQIFFMFIFFIGVKVEANPMNHCSEVIAFEDQIESILQLASEEQLNLVCRNITIYFECLDAWMKDQVGLNLKELANLLKGTDFGNILALFVNVEELIGELCVEGNELREDYLSHMQCYDSMDKNLSKHCKNEAQDVYESYRELQEETGGKREELVEQCITTAYQVACYGAAVHEDCGDGAFNNYKDIVKKIGFIKSGVCSSNIVDAIKTSLLENLDISESRKHEYRVILDLKKRRK